MSDYNDNDNNDVADDPEHVAHDGQGEHAGEREDRHEERKDKKDHEERKDKKDHDEPRVPCSSTTVPQTTTAAPTTTVKKHTTTTRVPATTAAPTTTIATVVGDAIAVVRDTTTTSVVSVPSVPLELAVTGSNDGILASFGVIAILTGVMFNRFARRLSVK